MAKKVLSIEISRTLVKVCEVDYQAKTSKVYQCFTFMTPSGVYEDGLITDTDSFGSYLKEQLSSHGIKNNRVVFTVTSARIANREVFIPFVKEKQIGAIVEANAKDYFPVDITGYKVAYNILDTVEKDSVKQYKLLVLASPMPMLESYFNLAKTAGLTVEAIDYSGNSIVPVIRNAIDNDTTMVIKVDEHTTLLTILKNKTVVMQRNLTQGADIAIETVRELDAFGTQQTYDDALNMLRGKTLIRKSFDETVIDEGDSSDDEAYKRARIELTASLQGLVSSIVRVVDYYNSRNSDDTIKRFYLTGFGGDFSGLSKLLCSEIGEKVTVLSHVNGITLDKSLDSERVSFGEYIACIGAAISPIDFIPDKYKKGNNKKEGGNIFTKDLSDLDQFQLSIIVMVVGLIISAALSGYSLYNYFTAKAENTALKKELEDLKPIIPIYNDYSKSVALYEDAQNMYVLTKDSNENIVNFLLELQQKMPTSIAMQQIHSTTETVELTMDVATKDDVGKVIEQLRTFDSIKDVSFTGATRAENELGEVTWSFMVTAYYADLQEDEAQQEDVQ